MFQVVVRKRAIIQAQETYNWYESQSINAANGFLEALENSYKRLSDNPQSYSYLNHRFRKIRLEHYPCLLIFEVKGNKVIIFTLIHTKRGSYLA